MANKTDILTDLLARAEHRMSELRARRTRTVDAAVAAIGQANRDFDRAAVPLGRRINQLRERLEAEKPEPPPSARPRPRNNSHDPDWSQADIDHYYELRNSGNKKSDAPAR